MAYRQPAATDVTVRPGASVGIEAAAAGPPAGSPPRPPQPDSVSSAKSTDWLTWQDGGPCIRRHRGGAGEADGGGPPGPEYRLMMQSLNATLQNADIAGVPCLYL